jgi:hypothetical protein
MLFKPRPKSKDLNDGDLFLETYERFEKDQQQQPL